MRSQHFRGNVFVANLPPDYPDEQLAEAFDSFGIVLSASIARDPETGKRLRYGFVDIATERAAKLAVESMNGTQVEGYKLDVRISERPAAAKKPPRPAAGPRRPPPRMAPRSVEDAGDDEVGDFSRPRTQPRRQPSFQVERRSLPRRPG
jgi:RNA recognition motif-containing protein